MGLSATLWQVDGESGPAWKEPVTGEEVPDEFPEESLDENGSLALDHEWRAIEALLDQVDIAAPWKGGEEELEAADVQRLATRLKPADWAALTARGVEADEASREVYETFRHFVIDAARSGNGLGWEID
jgi:hypothetical protein